MSNDTELFDLCKSVYLKTEWDSDDLKHHLDGEVYDRRVFESDIRADRNSYHPLYTSDYLLDRMPTWSELRKIGNDAELPWRAEYETPSLGIGDTYQGKADTPLKALLNLVIALDKAKELS